MNSACRAASSVFVSLSLLAFAVTGCTMPTVSVDEVESAEGAALADAHGIRVTAAYTYSFDRDLTRPPTYGDQQVPYMHVSILVEDAVIAASHPGFDGLERPFALVPRASGTGTRWERVELSYVATRHHTYFTESRRDEYRSPDLKLSEADLERARVLGVAVGLETNVGVVWAQNEGDNAQAVPAN